VIDFLNKIKPPYNINQATQDLAFEALKNIAQVNDWIKESVAERQRLSIALNDLKIVTKVYPSDANFILEEVTDALKIYDDLVEEGIIVRDRSKVTLCEGCLRITVGTKEENDKLLTVLKKL
jgi:histidinol-phosphate aminotransferase